MFYFAVIAVIAIVLVVSFSMKNVHENIINEKIESIGGHVVFIERRSIFSGLGPFHVVGKGRTVYMIIYKIHSKEKEGWVRFGGLFGPDWRL